MTSNALQILLEECKTHWQNIPQELVEAVYRIEERIQFDDERHGAPQKIRQELKAILDKEALKGPDHGDGI